MRILLVASAFNSLTQRVFGDLRDAGHDIGVELFAGDTDALECAVREQAPDLIIAPMLRAGIPCDVWSRIPCLIVHPGPPGDRGPSSLDRAVARGCREWGVTVLQAESELDAGPVWSWMPCRLPPRGKSDLYRGEVSDAASRAVLLAVGRFARGGYEPVPQNTLPPDRPVYSRPLMRQSDRRIDWAADSTRTVLRTLRAGDSRPGVLDELLGTRWYLHGGCEEDRLRGRPGELLATRDGAVCRATVDGAVWIPRLRRRGAPGLPRTFPLPAVTALGESLPDLPECPVEREPGDERRTWSDIRYRERGATGFLSFAFPGGAMGTDQCRRLLAAYREACTRPTSLLVVGGERDFFSNGIDLNLIEAAHDPAAESWANIQAIDDLVEAILMTTDRMVVAAVGGNAAAGGAMLALAADEVWCRAGAVLNPHYRLMGLYGSEYWTYSLPRRVGSRTAARLTEAALPVGAARAQGMGLVDHVLPCSPSAFRGEVARLAAHRTSGAGLGPAIARKKEERERQEAERPLSEFRQYELSRMRESFFDPQHPYHALRHAFVHKTAVTGTPGHLPRLPR